MEGNWKLCLRVEAIGTDFRCEDLYDARDECGPLDQASELYGESAELWEVIMPGERDDGGG